jgi:hypothetical protein
MVVWIPTALGYHSTRILQGGFIGRKVCRASVLALKWHRQPQNRQRLQVVSRFTKSTHVAWAYHSVKKSEVNSLMPAIAASLSAHGGPRTGASPLSCPSPRRTRDQENRRLPKACTGPSISKRRSVQSPKVLLCDIDTLTSTFPEFIRGPWTKLLDLLGTQMPTRNPTEHQNM